MTHRFAHILIKKPTQIHTYTNHLSHFWQLARYAERAMHNDEQSVAKLRTEGRLLRFVLNGSQINII